nr:sensor histidine kinase [Exiguobacterium indicum]
MKRTRKKWLWISGGVILVLLLIGSTLFLGRGEVQGTKEVVESKTLKTFFYFSGTLEAKDRQTVISDRDVRVTIRDEGPGIAEQDLPYVFDRFYQGEQSRANEGHGLGLSIVKRIIDLHDGELTIRNHSEQGARSNRECYVDGPRDA